MTPQFGKIILVFTLQSVFSLAARATPPSDPAAYAEFEAVNDPLEPLNRAILDLNTFIDRIVVHPLAEIYLAVTPEPGRNAVRHFLGNLGEPVVFINNLAQGEFGRAHTTFARFLFNSTFGIAGLTDPAADIGLEKQTGDAGQILYAWGAPEGPYLVLPVLGPSNPRDAIGYGAGGFLNSLSFVSLGTTMARVGVNSIDQRTRNSALDEFQRNTTDFYAALRSLSRQHRAQELRHGEPAPLPGLDEAEGETSAQEQRVPKPD